MTLFQLQCFISVAKTLNFTRSASELFITQPALSRSVSSLEQELNLKLLNRSRRAVSLTAAGQLFAKECQEIVSSFESGVHRAKLAVTGATGTLRLGFQRDMFESFTVDLVRSFRKAHPDIEVDLVPCSPTRLIRGLETAELDVIIAGDNAAPFTENNHLLLSSRVECAALPAGHPLSGRSSVRLEELKDEPFITMTPSASRLGFESLVQKTMNAGFSPKIAAQVDYVPSLLMLIACGKGVSILHRNLEKDAEGRVIFVPLEDVVPLRRWLIWNETGQNPCLKHLVETARQFACPDGEKN